jgi:hypothetical protein
MNEERMLKPALIGAVALGVLSSLPLVNCFCCAWIIGGGVLAASLYVRDSPVPVSLGRGVVLGLLTGVLGAIVISLFAVPLQMLMNPGLGFVEQMQKSMDQFPNVPPESRQMFQAMAAHRGFFYAMGLIFMLVICGLFGMVGGAVGVALFEKRKPGNLPLPPAE